ncbi:hypothetical protein BGZ63DRAFT_388024 [Mariannaea sp. PMI_226]|nr:hypothetical protein BGZ63DRAFT_388024 [Mariannaea sp. PMI_226]
MNRPSKRVRDDSSQAPSNKIARTGSTSNISSRPGLTAPSAPRSTTTASGEIPHPFRREDFEVAIICALPLEYDAVSLLFDEFWDGNGATSRRAMGNDKTYTTGRIGQHIVVLLLLPGMGKVHAASAAATLRSSYIGLRLALLVGICGGVPYVGIEEVILGDVIISSDVVQYDFGRQYPDRFVRKDTIRDNLSKPSKDIRNLLAIFQSDHGREQLQQRTTAILKQLQAKAIQKKRRTDYSYPGVAEDKLFEASYRHKHHVSPTCVCRNCHDRADRVCDEALDSFCNDLSCDERQLILRERLASKRQVRENEDDQQNPMIHVGSIASGDKVMKSGEDRDALATEKNVIAFEMEGAGVWEEIPCIVVKGVCDYADSHKNKKWQAFAAATAASTSKAILERFSQASRIPKPTRHWTVPFGRNESFIGREDILARLLARTPPSANKDNCQRTAIEGLGGIGKTQIAIEAAFRIRDEYPDCYIFWVLATDVTNFENAYRNIGRCFGIAGIDDDKADVKILVKAALSRDDLGRSWLLIIDSADDADLFFGPANLSNYLPFSKTGSILFTTRNHQIAVKLDIPRRGILKLTEMTRAEAIQLLELNLEAVQIRDVESTSDLLEFLADLPLAIKQASAFMAQTGMTTTKYLEYCQSNNKTMVELLSKDFEDQGRYEGERNPVATTWLISFEHISRTPIASQYLKWMSFLAEKEIPRSLLPRAADTNELQADEAIGVLKAYAFITQRGDQDLFDVHRLVHLVMRSWLEENGEQQECASEVAQHVAKTFPVPRHENRNVWIMYLPHAQALLSRDTCPKEPNLPEYVGLSFLILGKYGEAEQMYRQAFELRTKTLGQEHSDTLASMNNLSWVLRHLGRYNEAEQMQRQTLNLNVKVHGPEHPSTLTSMNILAGILMSLGGYDEAEQMHRQTFNLRMRILGQEHPDTLRSMNNLALTLRHSERYDEAEQMHRQTLNLRVKILGEEHPDTLSSMNNLALTLRHLERYDEAKQMHQQTLNLSVKILGKDHPNTLGSMDNLALILTWLGRYDVAEPICRQVVELRTKVLGRDHPDTLSSAHNLAWLLEMLGRDDEAEQRQQP